MAKNSQKRWSKKELEQLKKMCENGASHLGIARRLGRTEKAIAVKASKTKIKNTIKATQQAKIKVEPKPVNKVEVVPVKQADTRKWWQKLLGVPDQSADVQSLRIQAKELRQNLETIHQQIGQIFGELQAIKGDSAEFQYKTNHELDNLRQETVAKIARDVSHLALMLSKQETRTRDVEDASMDHSFVLETIKGHLGMLL